MRLAILSLALSALWGTCADTSQAQLLRRGGNVIVRGRNNNVAIGGGGQSFAGSRAVAFAGSGRHNVGFARANVGFVFNGGYGANVAFRSYGYNAFRFAAPVYYPPAAFAASYGGGCDLNALRGYTYAGPPTPLSEETTVTAPDGTVTRTLRQFR